MASLSRVHEDVAGGFDAPRNSLDETSSIETAQSVKPEDIPFGYEVGNPARDKKRRGPNVVARLMGLDTMPDDRHNSLPKMPRGKLRKTHPQEAELQNFKKEFVANNTNRQLEEKKHKVRAMLDKARLALSQGKKFEESQEFLEAMEFLQCNKDFIFQFLQEKPHVVFSLDATGTPRKQQQQHQATVTSPRKQSTERRRREPGFNPRALARLFMPSDPCKGNDQKSRTPTSTTSRYMLPTSSPRVQNNKATNKTGARDIIVEIKERLRRREQEQEPEVQHTKALRKHGHNFKDESQKTSNFTLTKGLSTGKRISMMRPDDMSDGEEIFTPKTLQITESAAAAETKNKKKTPLASLSSPRSSTEKCVKSKVENATRTTVNKSPRLSHSSVNYSNLTRCRSVPNVALLREQSTTGTLKNTSPKVAKPAQNGAQRKLGLFSVGRKKATPAAEPCNPSSKNGKDSNLRETKVRRNILDEASDQNGLLSRVSVLEPSESSLQFKDITNDLQDPLRVRLQRPQLDGRSKRVRDNKFDHTTKERQRSEVPHRSPSTNQVKAERRPGTALDFAFVRDILVASGFHLHGGRNITRWHSATQPISHRLLAKVESTGTFRRTSSSLHWRSLFDAINEVLIAKLEQSSPAAQCYGLPLVGVPSSAASGRPFVEDVWSEIHKRQFTSCQENFLHSLVAQDLQTTSSWLLLRRDVDRICLQLEKAIWNDLVEEFLLESVH